MNEKYNLPFWGSLIISSVYLAAGSVLLGIVWFGYMCLVLYANHKENQELARKQCKCQKKTTRRKRK